MAFIEVRDVTKTYKMGEVEIKERSRKNYDT